MIHHDFLGDQIWETPKNIKICRRWLAHWWSQVPTVVPGEMLSYAVKAGSYFSIVFTYDDPESEMQVWKGDILYSIIYIYYYP